MTKESPLMQELGRKKYYEKVEKNHKFYDNYKAGKRDPKTGEYYYPISFSNPTDKKIKHSRYISSILCLNPDCDNQISIKTTSAAIICPVCKCFHSITYKLGEDTFLVNSIKFNLNGIPCELEPYNEKEVSNTN